MCFFNILTIFILIIKSIAHGKIKNIVLSFIYMLKTKVPAYFGFTIVVFILITEENIRKITIGIFDLSMMIF